MKRIVLETHEEKLARRRALYKKFPLRWRHYNYKHLYGITPKEVEVMREAQNGLCALCRDEPAAQIDHDHLTKRVRGLLCRTCNIDVGHFESLLRKMPMGALTAYLHL